MDPKSCSIREGDGVSTMRGFLENQSLEHEPYAPPFLKAGDMVIAHVANILLYLGDHHDIAPKNEAGRLWANQLQLTVTDFVQEIHDAHHPIANALYYEDQKAEATQRTAHFLEVRAPKYMSHFERALAANPAHSGYAIGDAPTHPDLSLFQVIAGLRYGFPTAMARLEPDCPKLSRVAGVVGGAHLLAP